MQGTFLLITFVIIIRYRKQIAAFFSRINAPVLLVALIASLPFMIIEENINCGAFNCEYTLFPWTLPFLLAYTLLAAWVVRRFNVRFTRALVAFSAVGVLWEATVGVSSAEFQALPPLWFVAIALYVGMSYAYILAVPMTIAQDNKHR